MPKKEIVRFLCFHGFRTNGKILEKQMSILEKQVQAQLAKRNKIAEFHYLDAVYCSPLESVLPVVLKTFGPQKSYHHWWEAVKVPPTDQELKPKDFSRSSSFTYEGTEESIQYVLKYIQENGPFDGLIGFSQGGILATILSIRQEVLLRGKNVPIPWKFAILCCSMAPRDQKYKEELESLPRLSIPSVHIIGETDSMRPLSEQLVDSFELNNCQNQVIRKVLYHSGGHQFPYDNDSAKLYGEIAQFVDKTIENL